jgi:hypothetical protein
VTASVTTHERSRQDGDAPGDVIEVGTAALLPSRNMRQIDCRPGLGEEIRRRRLRELARHTSSTDAAFLYGRLYALEEAGAGKAQEHFDAAWTAAKRTSVHRWLR